MPHVCDLMCDDQTAIRVIDEHLAAESETHRHLSESVFDVQTISGKKIRIVVDHFRNKVCHVLKCVTEKLLPGQMHDMYIPVFADRQSKAADEEPDRGCPHDGGLHG